MKKWLIKFMDGDIIKVDKMLHFTVEFMLTAIFMALLNIFEVFQDVYRLPIGVLFVIVLGVLKEWFDMKVKKSGWDTIDLVYGIAGGFLFLIILRFL